MKRTIHTRNCFAVLALPFLAGAIAIFSPPAAQAQDMAEIARQLEALKNQVSELEARLAEAESRAAAAEDKADSAQQMAATRPAAPSTTVGPDGKHVVTDMPAPYVPDEGWWNRTSLGGYGELHLNLGDKEQIDFHRWVLFIEHEFNDRMRLFSELELEHSLAGDGKPGEIELEQAYVEFDVTENLFFKGGLFLIPVGILNEVHEPTTFFGVERNVVEAEIIPTTWWEGGLALSRRTQGGWTFDLAVHSALNTDNTFDIRAGREKVAEAPADDAAVTARAVYRGIPGLEIGGSVQYQTDMTQVTDDDSNPAVLSEAHIDWQRGNFGLRALYGRWDINGSGVPDGAEEQYGYYIQPSYTFRTDCGDIGFFGRYSMLDAVGVGGEVDIWTFGVNFWPDENIVFKADFQEMTGAKDQQTINFGIGYVF